MSETLDPPGGPEVNVRWIYICPDGHETVKDYTVGGDNIPPPMTILCGVGGCDNTARFDSSENLSLPGATIAPINRN